MNSNEKKLIELLKEKNPQTATELACQLNVSNRTVYRWAEKLEEKGLKITTTKGRNGGIFLESFDFDMSKIDKETCHNKQKNMTKTKVKDADFWIEISFSDLQRSQEIDTKYDICKNAILNSNVLSFSYTTPEGKILNCTTEPVRLFLSENNWHILAWIRKADKYKLFKLSNMTSIQILQETFLRQADFKIQEVLNQ